VTESERPREAVLRPGTGRMVAVETILFLSSSPGVCGSGGGDGGLNREELQARSHHAFCRTIRIDYARR